MSHMRYPVDYIKITQYPHQGHCIDFGHNELDMPVFACSDGIVIYSKYQTTGGNVVYIEHHDGSKSSYGHLKKVLVPVGQKVKLGEQIGIMGETGTEVTGVHLHFGLYSNDLTDYLHNSDLDPLEYLYVYDNQVVANETLINYEEKIKFEDKSNNIMYVYNTDDEGLNIRSTPNGKKTGKLLEVGTEVGVIETSNGWSRINDNEWVSRAYLTSIKPEYYEVSGADSEGLNIRNEPSLDGAILNVIKNGRKVQVYETKGSWARVSKDEERWCSKKYLVKA